MAARLLFGQPENDSVAAFEAATETEDATERSPTDIKSPLDGECFCSLAVTLAQAHRLALAERQISCAPLPTTYMDR